MTLDDLHPEDVAAEVASWISALTRQLASAPPVSWRDCSPALAAYELTRYAQTGERPEREPEELMRELAEALYTAPHPDSWSLARKSWEVRTGDLTRSTDVVLCAAYARVRLAPEQPESGEALPPLRVSARCLAALGGVQAHAIHTAGSRGTLQVERGDIHPAEAVRWLGERGVAPWCSA